MQNFKKQFNVLLLAFLAIACIACNNDDDAAMNEDPNAAGESLTAVIDGVNFSAMEVSVTATLSNNVLTIIGGDSSGNTFQMTVHNYSGPDTFNSGDAATNLNSLNYISISPVGSWSSTLNVGTGTLKVTSEEDGIVEGTFEFDGYNGPSDRKQIRSGIFKVNIE